jgi:hypothetical protein
MDDGLGETAFFDDLIPDQAGEPTHEAGEAVA